MCGIAGIVDFSDSRAEPAEDLLRRILGGICHRGPDAFGIYRDEHAGLAHSRLSIIDLSGGDQPIHNEDKNLWLIFNGEIFNYPEAPAAHRVPGDRRRNQHEAAQSHADGVLPRRKAPICCPRDPQPHRIRSGIHGSVWRYRGGRPPSSGPLQGAGIRACSLSAVIRSHHRPRAIVGNILRSTDRTGILFRPPFRTPGPSVAR